MADPSTLLSRPDPKVGGVLPEFTLPSLGGRPKIVEVGYHYGRYRIEQCLGVGGMGAVYRAYDSVLARQVALKTALGSPGNTDVTEGLRFLREAEVIARLSHPHVVGIYDLGMHEQTPYLVLEFLEGDHLRSLLDARKRLEPDSALRLMLPVLSAMAYAHRQGILHLDLKPSNIFITNNYRSQVVPKVLDFGVCQLSGLDSELDPTRGVFAGTPAYSSPESLGNGELTELSDQFSVGIVLYETLSGIGPFASCRTLPQVRAAMAERRYPKVSTLSPSIPTALCDVVQRTLDPEPANRFADMASLGRALLQVAPSDVRSQWRAEFEAAP